MYDALSVAKYIILHCSLIGSSISNLKLQKILYFIQAEFLVVRGYPCFEERIEAWDFGVVVPDVYHHYKIYGGASIPSSKDLQYCPFSKKDKLIADNIIDECSKYSSATLVEITCNQTPWKNAYRSSQNCEIPIESIKSFFETD